MPTQEISYKQGIVEAMNSLAKRPKAVFIGEGLINAGRIYGTLEEVALKKCLEMPIAENLIAGTAIGLALTGWKPVLIFQRMDFMLIAADAIINHMALIPKMSGGKIALPIIIRAILGSQKDDFDVGPQHNHNLIHVFSPYIHTIELKERMNAKTAYDIAYSSKTPTIIVERKDLY